MMEYQVHWNDFVLTATEHVVLPLPQLAELIDHLKDLPPKQAVADLGTGTGCMALWAEKQWPRAGIWATDLPLAQCVGVNRLTLNLNVHTVTNFWPEVATPKFDLVMSNPPHDTEAEWAAMPQAHDYLKKASVIAGATGLEHLFYILDTADAYTTDDAHLVLIHKQEQLAEIATRTPTWYLERTHVNDGVCMSVYTKRSGPANF